MTPTAETVRIPRKTCPYSTLKSQTDFPGTEPRPSDWRVTSPPPYHQEQLRMRGALHLLPNYRDSYLQYERLWWKTPLLLVHRTHPVLWVHRTHVLTLPLSTFHRTSLLRTNTAFAEQFRVAPQTR